MWSASSAPVSVRFSSLRASFRRSAASCSLTTADKAWPRPSSSSPCNRFCADSVVIDAQAERTVREAADKLQAAGYEVTVELTAGEPEKVIAESVVRHHAGVVLMGAYGHSRIRQLVVGSTTASILRTCRVPVLMFR